jgi:hypothetical protein
VKIDKVLIRWHCSVPFLTNQGGDKRAKIGKYSMLEGRERIQARPQKHVVQDVEPPDPVKGPVRRLGIDARFSHSTNGPEAMGTPEAKQVLQTDHRAAGSRGIPAPALAESAKTVRLVAIVAEHLPIS